MLFIARMTSSSLRTLGATLKLSPDVIFDLLVLHLHKKHLQLQVLFMLSCDASGAIRYLKLNQTHILLSPLFAKDANGIIFSVKSSKFPGYFE